MTLQINTHNQILIEGERTGLSVKQDAHGTVVTHCYGSELFTVPMPQVRYSLAHDAPASGVAGRSQFEIDVLNYLWEMQH